MPLAVTRDLINSFDGPVMLVGLHDQSLILANDAVRQCFEDLELSEGRSMDEVWAALAVDSSTRDLESTRNVTWHDQQLFASKLVSVVGMPPLGVVSVHPDDERAKAAHAFLTSQLGCATELDSLRTAMDTALSLLHEAAERIPVLGDRIVSHKPIPDA